MLSIVSSATAGRFYVAHQAIDAGTRLLNVEPSSIVVPEKRVSRVCASCFASATSEAFAFFCHDCHYVAYCSTSCQIGALESHVGECHALQRLRARPSQLDPNCMTILRLLLQTVLSRQVAKTSGVPHPTETLCTCLETFRQREDWAARAERYRAITNTLATICDGNLNLAPEELEQLLGAIDCNSFLVWDRDHRRELGLGLYVAASLFNHSCTPNVARVQRGRAADFYALRPVAAGEALCISYVDPRVDWGSRARELAAAYGFSCRCARCLAEEKDSEPALFGTDRPPEKKSRRATELVEGVAELAEVVEHVDLCPKHLGYLIPGVAGRRWCSVCEPPPSEGLLATDDLAWELFG